LSAILLDFPVPHPETRSPAAPAKAADRHPRDRRPFSARRKYSLSDMIRLCGLEEYERRTAIDHLRIYARQNGLPLPRNARVHKGRAITGPDAIGTRSSWDALAVDAWLDGPQPPQGGGALSSTASAAGTPPVPAPCRADMADRARQLAS
tara:strand:+ start:12002 stop:12451 length:450 start_codon:yes stop_codon:yes gene_type:complete